MTLDVPTLTIVSTCVASLLGLLLFLAWLQERNVRALAWWGGAFLMGGLGLALWITQGGAKVSMADGLPQAVFFLACAMIWNGARLFHGRQVLPWSLFAGPVLWLAACQSSAFTASLPAHVALSSGIVAVYTFFGSRELWSERRRQSDARWVALVVPPLHATGFIAPIPLVYFAFGAEGMHALASSDWGAIFILQTLLYAVGTAFIVMYMAKERETRVQRTAANTDPLTGVLNRRGFYHEVDALIARSKRGEWLSVLMCDIDHFKSINDRFGHEAGDETLRTFAAVLQGSLRAGDVIGRLGGEEFAVVLPGGLEAAATAGERVRATLEENGAGISGQSVTVTVSVGAATALATGFDIRAVTVRADAALYAAKSGGRNRVVLDAGETPVPPVAPAAPAVSVTDALQPVQTLSPVTAST